MNTFWIILAVMASVGILGFIAFLILGKGERHPDTKEKKEEKPEKEQLKKASGGGSMIFWPLSRLGVACLTAGLVIFCWWAWYEMKDSSRMHKGMMIADSTELKVSKLPKGGDKSKLYRYQSPQTPEMGELEGFLVPPGFELVVVPLEMTPDGSYQPSNFDDQFTYTGQKLNSDGLKSAMRVYTLYLGSNSKGKEATIVTKVVKH